ncbi:MAG: (Fe-S)-binding protein [Chloroflexi bacterium]|nr:MAG: (Fe-S)-binding protein [Chloroflexota bacterium]
MEQNAKSAWEGFEGPTQEDVNYCIRCGLCLSVCPTYKDSLRETESPRGRVALIAKAIEGELDLTRNFKDHMYRCLDCLACQDICPVGIQPANLCLEARYAIEQATSTPLLKPVLFGGIFTHTGLLEILTKPVALYERSGLRRLANGLRATRVLPAQLRDMERMLPGRLPLRGMRHQLPAVVPARGERRARVGYFLGCVQGVMMGDGCRATVEVLAENGCDVVIPSNVKCCGMPMVGYGFKDTARQVARHNIDLLLGLDLDTIVTDCATCGSSLKEYPHWLADDPVYAERAREFASRVRDVSEFLVEIGIRPPQGSVDARVTYHDPCHLCRAQGIRQQPREMLRAAGVELVEMAAADTCCGSAGTQLITHYHTSVGVLERKMDNVAATEAEIVASGCPGCQMQLGLGVKRRGLKARVVHPSQLLAQAYRKKK